MHLLFTKKLLESLDRGSATLPQKRGEGLCGLDQPGSGACADWDTAVRDTAAPLGIKVGSVAQALLGSASLGARVLDSNEWKRDG